MLSSLTTFASFTAYFGTVIGIIALAVGPFVQQSVSYIQKNGRASLQRCEATDMYQTQGTMYNAFHSLLVSNDFQRGGADDQALQELNNDCSTGNCTFPVFSSLGICSTCSNTTDRINTACSHVMDAVAGTRVLGCNSSWNGLFITNYTNVDLGLVDIAMETSFTTAMLDSYGDSAILDFSMLRSSASGLHATECVFYYCVRAYEASVQNNTLQQSVTHVWYETSATQVAGQPYKYFGLPGYEQPDSNDYIFIPPPDQWTALNLSGTTNFTVDWYTHSLLRQWLPNALSGSSYVNGPEGSGTTSSSYIVDQLYNNLATGNQDTTSMFDIVTMGMTDKFRKTCPGNLAAVGKAIGIATVLDVQWNWLILPAAVIALTIVFLGLTMFQSKEDPTICWKDVLLPFVLHGLSHEAAMTLKEGLVDDIGAMEKNARRLKVKLERAESGAWHLHEADRNTKA